MREWFVDGKYEDMRCFVISLFPNRRELLKQLIVAKTRFMFEPQRYPVQVLKIPENGIGVNDLIVESGSMKDIASIEFILSKLKSINHDDSSQVESSVNKVVELRRGVKASRRNHD